MGISTHRPIANTLTVSPGRIKEYVLYGVVTVSGSKRPSVLCFWSEPRRTGFLVSE